MVFISPFCFVVVFFKLFFLSSSSSKFIYCNIFFLSISSFFSYSLFLFCIRTCEKFTLVNYIVFLVFFCYAALLICVGCRGFCDYWASKVKFLSQLWLTLSPINNFQHQRISTNLRSFWEVIYSEEETKIF